MPKFNSGPANFPIVAYYKGSFALLLTFTNTEDASVYEGLADVSGASFIIKDRQGEAAVSLSLDNGLTIDSGAGTILLQITNAQIVSLATQEYDYEFLLTFSNGAVWPILDAVFDVTADGTTDSSAPPSFTIRGGTITVAVTQGDFPAQAPGNARFTVSGDYRTTVDGDYRIYIPIGIPANARLTTSGQARVTTTGEYRTQA